MNAEEGCRLPILHLPCNASKTHLRAVRKRGLPHGFRLGTLNICPLRVYLRFHRFCSLGQTCILGHLAGAWQGEPGLNPCDACSDAVEYQVSTLLT
jgi:hypothetical protein